MSQISLRNKLSLKLSMFGTFGYLLVAKGKWIRLDSKLEI